MEVDKWLPVVKEGQDGESENLMDPGLKSILKLYCDLRYLYYLTCIEVHALMGLDCHGT